MAKLKRNSRPTDINQAAHTMVYRSTEEKPKKTVKVVVVTPQPSKLDISRVMSAMGKKGGKIGGKRSLETLTLDERRTRALNAAKARWAKKKSNPTSTRG
jgi:prolyl-tRNA editing enzyme YbaK/EbsC (Cys-tRNA(Pro) deacylase)